MTGQVQPKMLFRDLIPNFQAIFVPSKSKEKAETIFKAFASKNENIGAKDFDACFSWTKI
jgi:hypothetical protein